MGFIVDKKLFMKALTSVMPAVSARSALPILSGVKLCGADSRFVLEATDLELVIRIQGPQREPEKESIGRLSPPRRSPRRSSRLPETR